MKRRQKTVWLLALTFALLIALFAGVKLLKRHSATAEPESQTTEELLLAIEPEEAIRLKLTANGEALTLEKQYDTWVERAHPDLPIQQGCPTDILEALSPLTALRALGAVDKGEFGLRSPWCTVHVSAGGSEFGVALGSYHAAMKGYYAMVEGQEGVYLIPAALGNAAGKSLCDMVVRDEIPALDELTGLRLGQATVFFEEKGLESVYTPEYQWFYRADAAATPQIVGEERLQALTTLVSDMTWDAVVDVAPTEAALSGKYGLCTPALTVSFDYLLAEEKESDQTDITGTTVPTTEKTPATFTLSIGRRMDDAHYYASVDRSPLVYALSAATAEALLDVNGQSLLPTDVLRMDWATVDSMEITAGSISQRIRITTMLSTDKNGDRVETYAFSESDVTLDHDLCEAFIDYLSEMQAEDTAFDAEVRGEERLAILFHRKTEGAFAEMRFDITAYDDNFSLVSFNDYHYILVSNRDVEELLLRFGNIR